MPVFDTLTLSQATSLIPALPWALAATAYVQGDHWQAGAGWVGPWPSDLDTEAQAVRAEIARAFVAQNAIGEVVSRHTSGVIGREPAWGLTVRRPLKPGKAPTRAEQALIDEAEAALTAWWDARMLLTTLQQLTDQLVTTGRATLRLFVPSGMRQDTGRVPPAPDLESALGYLFVDRPLVNAATEVTDPLTQHPGGITRYRAGATLIDPTGGVDAVELTYTDDAGQTVLRIVRGDTVGDGIGGRWPMQGRLLAHTCTRDPLITESVIQLQRQLNLAHTMSGRNVVQGGFLERLILNGQLPGSWVDDPTAPIGPDGTRRRFVPAALKVGAGRTNFISGQPIRDQSGRVTGYTTPSAVYRDPVSTATFEERAQACYRAILGEAKQLHALISGDSTASGASRVQARADFAKSLMTTATQLQALIRWLIEASLSLAAIFAGTPGRYDSLRATATCHLDTGPLSAEERRLLGDEVDAGRLSLETFLALVGHEDVDAEMQRIAAEKDARAQRAQDAGLPTPPDPTQPDLHGQQPPQGQPDG